jgi:zinc protease
VKPLIVALLGLAVASAHAQNTGQTVVPPDAREAKQSGAWESIPVPPLPEFHPAVPRRVELPNGAVLLLMEDHELPFVNGFVEMRGGDRDLPASKAGFAGIYGQAWRTSGTAAHSGDALDDILEAKAAKIETSADADSSAIAWSSLKGDGPEVFRLMLDLLLHPKWSPAKLQLAQQQTLAGIVRRNDSADEIAEREAAFLVYGKNSPYAREPEVATVMSITADDLEQFHKQTVVPNRMIIGVSGDFSAGEMEQTLRDAFAALPKGTDAPRPPDTQAGPKPALYLVDKKDVNQSNVWIVGLGVRRDDPDYYTLSVMNEIFGDGFSSRLFQNVRTRLGLAYSVGGGVGWAYDHLGMFHVSAETKSASTEAATAEMLKEIDGLRTRPFTEDELRMAKDQVLNSFIFRVDSRDKILNQAARLAFYRYPADELQRYRAGVEKVTVADLERVAKARIDPSKLAVLIVGNQSQFGTPLTSLGLGPAQPLDITIPIPPAMRKQLGDQ